jgi:hypothetical protein
MEILTAAAILLTALAYLVVRIVVFVLAVRRKERGSSQEKDQG